MFKLFKKNKFDIFKIDGEEFTPNVLFDINDKVFTFSGKCCPENGFLIFNPIFAWFDSNKEFLPRRFDLVFNLEYFNSVSHKLILRLLHKINVLDSKVTIIWQYNSEDLCIKHHAEIYQELIPSLKFKMQPYKL